MENERRQDSFDEVAWVNGLLEQFGPLVSGEDLRTLLGFKTAAAFQKAVTDGSIAVATFHLPGRKGRFAVTSEVGWWLVMQRRVMGKRPRKSPVVARKEEAPDS